jgi:hypothetical protein
MKWKQKVLLYRPLLGLHNYNYQLTFSGFLDSVHQWPKYKNTGVWQGLHPRHTTCDRTAAQRKQQCNRHNSVCTCSSVHDGSTGGCCSVNSCSLLTRGKETCLGTVTSQNPIYDGHYDGKHTISPHFRAMRQKTKFKTKEKEYIHNM